MTKADIVTKVAKALKIKQVVAEKTICIVLDTIKQGIIDEGKVTIRGFGCFNARNKSERQGRNPKTGKPAIIKARRVASFKAYNPFKHQVNS